jgi:uncharacterized protein (TIGR03083 family)
MTTPGPIYTASLFAGLSDKLVTLLGSLSPADWERPTVAKAWKVRDVAAHLLDGKLRKLSFHRDGLTPPAPPFPIEDDADLLRYLNGLNAEWVEVARRFSPAVITAMLAVAGPAVAAFVERLDPAAPSLFPVAWAGEAVSTNWMDTGREYTEHWHHQAQIREAVGRPLLDAKHWLYPVIDVSMRALPHAYRGVAAAPGTLVSLAIEGPAGGHWILERRSDRWALGLPAAGEGGNARARLSLSADTAWRIFFKALPVAEAERRVSIEGDAALARPFLSALAVMA